MKINETAKARFRSFRRGYIDAVAYRAIPEYVEDQVWYDIGWREGRSTFRARLNGVRVELGLPPENMVHIAEV